ncbi:MAG: hypothetical protein H6831_04950 [Planctomycetes bacterium]|nr:hypothetical protein [Planctomycetota bacterium]
MSRLLVLASIFFATVLFLATSTFASPQSSSSGPGSWQVADGGATTIASNITSAKTYQVSSKGPDRLVQVQVFNEKNELVNSVDLEKNRSVDVGVPKGGSLKVLDSDANDPDANNTDGASGDYKVLY